jgi:hypothetical protein
MIDVHSHYFSYPGHFSDRFRDQARGARGDGKEVDLAVRWEDCVATAGHCDKAILSGGKALFAVRVNMLEGATRPLEGDTLSLVGIG